MVVDSIDSSLEESVNNEESMEVILNECKNNDFPDSVMAFNLAKCTDEERFRQIGLQTT
jgi:hypothetical protein